MDFTYILAFGIGAVVMIASHVMRLLAKAPLTKRWSAITILVSLALSGLLLLNWTHLFDWGVGFAAMDLAIIGSMTLIGNLALGPFSVIALIKR